jgi:hypothetical protein
MAEYLGYAICFLFLEDGIEWSVYVNESGILVTQEPDVMHFEYPDMMPLQKRSLTWQWRLK